MITEKYRIKKDDRVRVIAGKDKGKIGKPIQRSNVMLMCNKCVTPIRIKMKRLEDGKKIRVCRKCGEIIDS